MHVCMYACHDMSCHVTSRHVTSRQVTSCHVCRYVCRYVCMHACMHACMYVNIFLCTCQHENTCNYICILHINLYIYIQNVRHTHIYYIYIYTHIFSHCISRKADKSPPPWSRFDQGSTNRRSNKTSGRLGSLKQDLKPQKFLVYPQICKQMWVNYNNSLT